MKWTVWENFQSSVGNAKEKLKVGKAYFMEISRDQGKLTRELHFFLHAWRESKISMGVKTVIQSELMV